MIADAPWALFEVPARKDVCVELPYVRLSKGETAADTVGEVKVSLYGTMGTSANWQEEVNKRIRACGFTAGIYNPCTYFHRGRKLRCLVHGDDFVCDGEPVGLE